MPEPTRQLAAIMPARRSFSEGGFTDIVVYTALIGKDSNKAPELVRLNKKIQKPSFEKHKRKWLKELDEREMPQFNAALGAANCAIEIRKYLTQSLLTKNIKENEMQRMRL